MGFKDLVKQEWQALTGREQPLPERAQRASRRDYSEGRRYEDHHDRWRDHRHPAEDFDGRDRPRHGSISPREHRGDEQRKQGSYFETGYNISPSAGGHYRNQNLLSPRPYDDRDYSRGRTPRRVPSPHSQFEHEYRRPRPQIHQSRSLGLYSPSQQRPTSEYFDANTRQAGSTHLFTGDSEIYRPRSTGDIESYRMEYIRRDTFIHEPLSDPGSEIRLLSVDRKVKDTIYCRIRHERLRPDTSGLAYTALSYTWGSKAPTSTIVIDYFGEKRNRTFQVTQNLYNFLEHVVAMGITPGKKHPRYTNLWWIDAICIIQKEEDDTLEEKPVQLDMMPAIYSNAVEVYAWIGPGSPDENHAMRYIKKTKSLRAAAEDGYDDNQLAKVKDRLDAMSPYIEKLFSAEYWGRLWILQELAVSANTTLACATAEVRWDKLVNFATHVAELNRDKQSIIVKRQYVWLLTLIYNEQRWRLDLAMLIHLSEQAECTDQKDRIIALLGLRPGNNLPRPRVSLETRFPCETFYWAIHEMIRELGNGGTRNSGRHGPKVLECRGLAQQAHRQPPKEEHGRYCENWFLCRKIARIIVGHDPIVLDHSLENGDRWYFHRSHMDRDKSQSRSRSRSRSRSHSRNRSCSGTSRPRSRSGRGRRSSWSPNRNLDRQLIAWRPF